MADVFSTQKRSEVMSLIRDKDTKPEIMVRRFLRKQGFGYRKHVSWLPGKPDIVLTKYRCAIFVNGCFWHGHEGCKYFVIPKTRTEWWMKKISETRVRDKKKYDQLLELGWRVFVIWECDLKNCFELSMDTLAQRIRNPNLP